MARQKSKRKQGRKQQNMRRENKVHLAGLGDTVNLVGAWVAFHHPAFTLSVAFIIWVIACWERNRSSGSSAETAVGTSPEFWVPWRRQFLFGKRIEFG